MRAVVLVGGEGTRLRPLTETMPKPLVPLMDRASLDHVLDHLARHDVDEVVLSSSYLEQEFHAFIDARRGDPRITWITEEAPLGTGGAIVNAVSHFSRRERSEPFFALNGDILTDLDLTAMRQRHVDAGAAATIALTHVEDARPFGLVPMEPDGRVLEFREKPTELMPGDINAGTYVLSPDALEPWEAGRNVSIEREIFPSLIGDGLPVHGFLSDAYWMDLGTPEQYLQAHFDILDGKVAFEPRYASPFVAEDARVDPSAALGPWVVVGAGAEIGVAATIADSVLHPGSGVGDNATVSTSILGPGARVGVGANVRGSVLGEGAIVPAGSVLDGAKVAASAG
jgi:mannose-1-phosphate guanylyltransferase